MRTGRDGHSSAAAGVAIISAPVTASAARRCFMRRPPGLPIAADSRGTESPRAMAPTPQRAIDKRWFYRGMSGRTCNPAGVFSDGYSQSIPSPCALHRARPDPRPLGPHLRAPARRLGRQRHQDRDAAGREGRRRPGRAARGLRLPEPAPQQAEHDAQPEIQGRPRGVPEDGEEGRRRGRELPARREAAARRSTTRT